MNIVRDGKTYTLTEEEVAMAHAEFVVSFMEDELISSFSLDEGMAKEVARAAYDRYCEGNGETEYECLEWAYDKYSNSICKENEKTDCHWSEIRNNYVDDDNICYIDAWMTCDDNEEGTVVAYVDMNTAKVIFRNPLAIHDTMVREAIAEVVDIVKKKKNSLSSNTSMNFIRNLWEEFGNIPMDPETENLEEGWLLFPKGTHRETIWDWFEEKFDISVAKDLMHV